MIDHTCNFCGKTFQAYPHYKRKFCSKSCASKATFSKTGDLSKLKQMQSLPLSAKISLAKRRIKEFYEALNGKVYVSFSGGKDSLVLLHLVRSIYPDVEAVFCDTGLEYPEIHEVVNSFDNVRIIKPKKTFFKVIEEYGLPVVSKEVSKRISRHRGGSNKIGNGSAFDIPKKWQYLVDADFKISESCCYWLKKSPFKQYEKETGNKPFIGVLAEESHGRRMEYVKNNCNVFEGNNVSSRPMMVWTEQDVLEYIVNNDLSIAGVYGEIVKEDDKYVLTGVKRTGCMACLFGIHKEKSPNRLEQMKISHPKYYKAFLSNATFKKGVEALKIKY